MNLNLTAPINLLSYGIVARNILKALTKQSIDVALWPIGSIEFPIAERQALEEAAARQATYDPCAHSLRIYHQFDLAQHVGRGCRIGFPIFELDRFKAREKHHINSQDAIFVCSDWAREVVHSECERIADVIPLGVDPTIFNENVQAIDLGLPANTTVFMNIGKWEVRKAQYELIHAFNHAFDPQDKVALVLHCKNPFFSSEQENEWVRCAKTSKMGEKIIVINDRFESQEQIASLMAAADCGVFPSRAEGWNLPASEMMRMGKHIIITRFSAHTEFCDGVNSRLIYIDGVEDADDGKWFDSTDPSWGDKSGQWAHIGPNQIDQMVAHMRSIHNEKQSGVLPLNIDGIETMKKLTWDNTARCIMETL